MNVSEANAVKYVLIALVLIIAIICHTVLVLRTGRGLWTPFSDEDDDE